LTIKNNILKQIALIMGRK